GAVVKQMRLLLVEDSLRLQELLADPLRRAGYGLDAVGTVADLLSSVAVVQYDLIIVDLGLPDGRWLVCHPQPALHGAFHADPHHYRAGERRGSRHWPRQRGNSECACVAICDGSKVSQQGFLVLSPYELRGRRVVSVFGYRAVLYAFNHIVHD